MSDKISIIITITEGDIFEAIVFWVIYLLIVYLIYKLSLEKHFGGKS